MNVGGLLFKMGDSNMQYVTSTTFLLLTYAKYLTSSHTTAHCNGRTITPNVLRAIAKKQVSMLLFYFIFINHFHFSLRIKLN